MTDISNTLPDDELPDFYSILLRNSYESYHKRHIYLRTSVDALNEWWKNREQQRADNVEKYETVEHIGWPEFEKLLGHPEWPTEKGFYIIDGACQVGNRMLKVQSIEYGHLDHGKIRFRIFGLDHNEGSLRGALFYGPIPVPPNFYGGFPGYKDNSAV